MRADYHVHTDYSDDSWFLMPDVIETAIEKGFDEICITEHVDYGVKEDWTEDDDYIRGGNKIVKNVNYPLYFAEIEELQEKYKDQIVVKVGMEFGMQKHTIDQFQQLFDSYPFDFILLSIHQIDDQEFHLNQFQKGRTDYEIYERYYEEMKYLVENYQDYSVLAHMDLIRRYVDIEPDTFEDHKEIITDILKTVIENGKGIEINNSSVRYGVPGLTPSIEILKLYHALGGKIITIGSDSHNAEQMGAHYDEARQTLKDIGFTEYCTFDKMEPKFWPL